MNFKIGEINTLLVDRQTDIGYMLTNDDNEEVFIHNHQVKENINPGDKIKAFLFFDSKKRLTATMENPVLTVSKPGFVKVVNVVENLGVFINNNISKDLLISADDLPEDKNTWPKENDTIFCKLKNTNSQLLAKIVNPKDINNFFKPTIRLARNQKAEAIVIKTGSEGINLITKEGHNVFVYYKHKRKEYRIGEKTLVTITNVKDAYNYNGTLLESKLELMDSDADIILQELKKNNGFIPFNSKSDIDNINETFNMSKAAFKRALSNLYKKRLIEIKEDGTHLIKKD